MTGPATGKPAADTRAQLRTVDWGVQARGIGGLLAAGLALRIIIAYLLPGSGFGVDLNAFQYWAADLAAHGPLGFYTRGFFADYTPGYLYVLWLVGIVGQVAGGIGDLIKVPAILADLAIGWLIWRMILDLGASNRRALIGAALFVFNPISWFDSTVWGQVDSVGVVFLLLGLREIWKDRPERSAVYAVIAAIIKPQLGILIPIVAVVVIRRYYLDARGRRAAAAGTVNSAGAATDVVDDGEPTDDPQASPAHESWTQQERGPIRVLTTALTGLLTATLLCLPFGMTVIDLLRQIASTAAGYPYLTVNAYNPWALITQNSGSLAATGQWIRDISGPTAADVGVYFGPVPALVVGTLLLLAAIAAVSVIVARWPDRLTVLVGLTVLAVAFFVLPTRVHERYLFPFFALAAILAAFSSRWLIAYAVLSVTTFLNLYVVLTTLYPDNPSISDWLGIGPAVRSSLVVSAIALINLAAFVWVAAQLRRSRARALERDLLRSADVLAAATTSAVPGGAAPGMAVAGGSAAAAALDGPGSGGGAGVGGTAATSATGAVVIGGAATAGAATAGAATAARPYGTPRPYEFGIRGAIRRLIEARPVRRDRSQVLAAEPRGRLDRLDLWLMVVLVISTMTLRTFRLAEPYTMHFDEVYHARTATEFLQFWKYGIPHDIYEYTHPHLAKYAMAGGLVAFGNNQVTSTSSLGVPVKASAIEIHWTDPALPDGRAGDRVYVATGSEVRAYDLLTTALVATIPIPGASSVAVDESAHQLFIGTDDGQVFVMDTNATFDALRAGGSATPIGEPTLLAKIEAPITTMLAAQGGQELMVATASEVMAVNTSSGAIDGRTSLPGVTEFVDAGSNQEVVAQPGQILDPVAVARQLILFLGGGAAELEGKLRTSADQVLLGPAPTASARTGLDQAIANGLLTGVSVQAVPEVAAIDPTGLTFISSGDAAVASKVAVAGATGGALTSGLDAPRIYVAADRSVVVVRLPSDQATAAPYVETTIKMPGSVSDVEFNPTTDFVHVLGRTPDDTSATIYVIEPHGNAVFADAPLPFTPSAWVTDAQPLYPSQDRQNILTFSPDGASATVDIGNNPFAWRLPGVIAGALTAGFLYLLARILFRRRSIGVLAAIFIAVDGMAFVQSRIGMNDVYVGLFIVAAYALFAALWIGVWQRRAAFWLLMPAIGVLLGLALSSKWVGLYAIAGIGVLVLARSALGRLAIILGMIVATTVLGYMGLVVAPGGTNGGNLLFMILMIGLTLAAVLISVLHPIEWSDEEVRFAIGAPVAAGIVLLLLAVPFGIVDLSVAVSSVRITVLDVSLGLVLLGGVVALGFWAAARFGFGPLAPPLPPDAPRSPEAAAPAAEGWLRLGSGLGMPAVWMGACLLVLPIVVYVISYLPWVALGNRLTDTWPPGHTGQTLLQLTQSMYDYHNNLRAAHAASSPWWAWAFDLKPVWFYQGSFAGDTAASIYDAGNLVIWWLGVPAMAFISWQAFKRRSLGLALIVLAFAWQWLPWVRIDRATFEYHYYTSVPFIILALAYFLAELWHGASAKTWLLARVAAAVAIVGPALMWVGKAPLCSFVRVDAVNPGSQACIGNPGDLVVTAKVAGVAGIMIVAIILLIFQLIRLQRPGSGGVSGGSFGGSGGGDGSAARESGVSGLAALALTALVAAVAIGVANLVLGSGEVFAIRGFQSGYLALLLAIPLFLVAGFVLTARDARRFVVGTVFAAVMWFLIFYPNLSALPLPSTIVNAYQGLLPTYLYPFQFPVNTDPAAPSVHLFSTEPVVLLLAITFTCLVVGYAAWVWRIGPPPSSGDQLAPSGGEA